MLTDNEWHTLHKIKKGYLQIIIKEVTCSLKTNVIPIFLQFDFYEKLVVCSWAVPYNCKDYMVNWWRSAQFYDCKENPICKFEENYWSRFCDNKVGQNCHCFLNKHLHSRSSLNNGSTDVGAKQKVFRLSFFVYQEMSFLLFDIVDVRCVPLLTFHSFS